MTLRELYFFCLDKSPKEINQNDIRDLILEESNISLKKSYFVLDKTAQIDLKNFFNKLDLLKSGTPLPRIIKKTWFYSLELDLFDNVFLPRPETEQIVKEVLAIIKKKPKKKFIVFDFGSGSGAISLAIKHSASNVKIYGIDKSHSTVENANANAKKLNLDVTFLEGDGFASVLELNLKADILVSNPPYIDLENSDWKVMKNTMKHDPLSAIIGSDHGLYFYWLIFENIKTILSPESYVILEIGFDLKRSLEKLCNHYFDKINFQFKKDLNNHWRYLIIKI